MESKAGSKFLFCRASYRKTASHFSGRTIALPALPKAHAQFIAQGHEPQFPPPSHAGAFALLPPLAGSAMSDSCRVRSVLSQEGQEGALSEERTSFSNWRPH